MLELRGVAVRYGSHEAVRGVDLVVAPGETVGVVGESGSGKSSVAKAAVGLNPLAAGAVVLDDEVLATPRRRLRQPARRGLQLVFQDPHGSLNPRMSVGETLVEAAALGGKRRSSARSHAGELLDLVGLPTAHLRRYPHQLSGGQLQRVAIARALAVSPRYLLLDEVTASLDVSVQARVLNLLRRLQRELGFSMLYISHDLSVVRYLSDRVYVMRAGEVVEHADVDQLFTHPATSYTRLLLDSVPVLDGTRWRGETAAAPDPLLIQEAP